MRGTLLTVAFLMPVLTLEAQDVGNVLRFEVASIKERTVAGGGPQSSPDRYTRSNVSLRDLIEDAYHLQRYEIVGGPEWITGSVRFDVNAKASFVPSAEQMRLMVQQLLAERFALRAHKERREMPIYVLHLARSDGRLGPQLSRTAVDCAAIEADRKRTGASAPLALRADDRPLCGSFMRGKPGSSGITLHYQASGVASSELASWLSPYVGRAVVDRTGLMGDFDLDLAFNPDRAVAAAASLDAPVSIFTAIQEQLGLKLESTRGPVDVLVIDGAQLPTPD